MNAVDSNDRLSVGDFPDGTVTQWHSAPVS